MFENKDEPPPTQNVGASKAAPDKVRRGKQERQEVWVLDEKEYLIFSLRSFAPFAVRFSASC
jgi:hypothetical protein